MVVQDPLLCDLPIQVTLEEVNSQIALEYGQAMTVRVCKMDGEVMQCHSPGPEEGYPEIRAAQAGEGRRCSAHKLVLCVADVPSDLSWGEAHRGQEEAQRLWHPEPR
ncbi:U11/U12 small nuclear ribonucleoprotein 25 kDa protein isoform X3 [Rattus norvegicus]|uniref:U11/U12 small nuclear ribonucleoprotein 25 kDa protein isoform X3 n=1 Tax=Rattus norvegicus TaxID=10116 RepID=UPI002FD7AC07